MAIVFVDANVFLGFWSLREGRVSFELLPPLTELAEQLLITKQVVDEVNRNKLKVFLAGCLAPSVVIPNEIWPENGDERVVESNSALNSLRATTKTVLGNRQDINKRIAAEISSNTDHATRMLNALFSSAVVPTGDQLKAARERRERGNPPGKPNDPLGDQISWEQFLCAAKGETSAWLITRDGDYAQSFNKKLLLNPYLHRELTEAGVKNVHVFDSLAAAIDALKKAGLIKAEELDGKKLTQLEKAEEEAHVRSPDVMWLGNVWRCPVCSAINQSTNLSAHPSRFGGWSYWATCRSCGHRFDTGEPYDD